ncbi:hypothetical protein GCM10009557_64390 [Virgisporangium ochraceum]|uniref:Uncharacterized protein n=1 Tax=Virgisporangium ochraceum TaxID=65505 RepID=A0A8J4A157_9ACTN|nr:hypothetical protein [Virgisporangium ochraceum]GIJ72188.1 hypothetical protein Voc01_071050 [Virgisporangium ochraceum]
MAKRPWNWNDRALTRFVAAARAGDVHTILDLPPDRDPRAALLGGDARKYKHAWERLLALHVARDHFEHEVDGVIYDYAEVRFFRNDDDGYVQQRLAVDLGVLHSVDAFGVHDGQLAYGWWQAALEGPYPEGAREELARIGPLLDERTRALLAPLMTP